MDSFRFAHPYFLYLLLLVPFFALLMFYFGRQRRKAFAEFGEIKLISHLMPAMSDMRFRLKSWILIIAFALQVVVMAGPQFGAKLETTKRKGIDLMIAVDVSNSMNARDVQPSRLDMAKMAVSRLVDKLSDDRIGIVVFAGQAYVQLPITTDYPSAKMFLQSINTNMVQTQGTAIGSAINLCLNSFSLQQDINRAIVVITDGENHEDDAIEAATKAAQMGVKVYTVGMGTTKGAPVPIVPGDMTNFIKDKDGQVVITRIDEQSLMQVAAAGNGAYVSANNIRTGINALIEELESIEKSEFEAKVFTAYNEQFQYFEAVVLALLLIDLLILGRKNPKFSGFDIFSRKNEKRDLFIEPTSKE